MAEEVASLVLKADSSQVNSATKSLGDFASQGKKAEESAGKFSSSANIMANSVKILAGAFASLKILEYAKEAAMLSARYDGLGVVMGTVGRNAGYTAQQMEAASQALQKTGISMIGSREQVLKLVQSHIDLAHATKLARIAQDAAYIANINSTEAFERLVHGIRTGQTEVLRSLGLNISLEESYKKYAQTLGITSSQLSQQQKLQAVLNAAMHEGQTIAGTYEAAMGTAGKQINSTERYVENLKVKLGGLFDGATLASVTAYTDLLKELDRQADSMAASGELKDWAHRIAIEFAGLADITRVFIGQAEILFKMLSTGFSQIKGGDFAGLTKTFMNADEALKSLYLDGEKYQDQVNKRVIIESMLTDKVTGHSNALKDNGGEQDKIAEKIRKAQELTVSMASKQDVYNKKVAELNELKPYLTTEIYNRALKKAHDELTSGTQKTKAYNVEIYKLKEAEKQLAGARDIEYQKLKRHETVLNEARQLTESTRTSQEKYNASIQRFNELRPYITADVYSKAVANARMELERADQTNKQFNENWRHAWSNMEQTGRMAFTQFAAHGVSAMESIGNALKLAVFDLLYHLTARRWIINLGTSLEGALFGAAGSAAGSAAGAGFFAGGFGKGVTGLVGRGGSMLPGALGTFFGGMSGAGAFSAAGGAGTAFIGGPGTAIGGTGMGGVAGMGARFGSMMSAAAGPLALAFGLDAIGRMIGGDKKLGGAEKIPVIGGFLAGLFGRGPLKQKETTLSGDIGLGGFESGMLQTVFKAKGGLFRSNKTDFARVDAMTAEIWTDNQKQLGQFAKDLGRAAKDIFAAFNEAAKESNKIINTTADNLGLSTESMKDFNYQLNLVSEKGKGLTEEQVSEEIEKMSSAMAEKFIPNIRELTKANESSIDALNRLNNEFLAINQAARVLGMSLSDAKVYVQAMGFELRTAFTDAAGGVDSFNSKISFVAENFLTAEQRFSMGIETLNSQLTKAGVPLDATKESFYQLLRVTAAAGDAVKFGGLLDIAPLFIEIKNNIKSLADSVVTAAADGVTQARNTLANVWAEEENRLKSLISQFKGISDSLKTFKNNLLQGSLSTLDPTSKYAFARSQFQSISTRAKLGDANAAAQLQSVSEAFLTASQGYYASSGQYESDFQSVMDAVTSTAEVADRQESLLSEQLNRQTEQIRVLLDIKTEIISLEDAIAGLTIATSSMFVGQQQTGASFNPVTSQVISSAGQSLGDVAALRAEGLAQIAAGNAIGVYNYAKDKGISLSDANLILGYEPGTAEKWATENKLPKFKKGANEIPHDMVAMLHRGEEVRPYKQVEADREAQKKIIAELQALVSLQASANQVLIEKLENIEASGKDSARIQRRNAA